MIGPGDFPPAGPQVKSETRKAVIALLHDRAGRILLQLRDDLAHVPEAGRWSLFGGGVEPGENLVEAMLREIDEELAVRLDPARLSPLCRLRGFAAPDSTLFAFTTDQTIEPGDIRLGEGAGFAFFTPAQCTDLPLSRSLEAVLTFHFGAFRESE